MDHYNKVEQSLVNLRRIQKVAKQQGASGFAPLSLMEGKTSSQGIERDDLMGPICLFGKWRRTNVMDLFGDVGW